MTAKFLGAEDGGQALVVVGLAMVVLMGSLVLAIDWGYGLVHRRASQNEADAAALAAGRLLASTFVSATQRFGKSQEDVWTAACNAARKNTATAFSTMDHSLSVWFSADPPTTPFSVGGSSTWTGITASSNNCAAPASGPTDVDGNTVLIRVESSATYFSIFGLPARERLTVGATARVRLTGAGSTNDPVVAPLGPVGDASVGTPGLGLSGSSTAPNVAIWPIVIHYNPSMWSSSGSEITLIDWDRGTQYDTNLFVSLAHRSATEAANQLTDVHQLITESDYSATGAAHHGHPITGALAGGCGTGPWDSAGSTNPSTATTCDVPNWFRYGYRGSLSIGTRWDDVPNSWNGFRTFAEPVELPDRFPGTRSSCAAESTYPYFSVPSCRPDSGEASRTGDWVETLNAGVDRVAVGNAMLDFIARYGRVVPATGDTAVVVNVFLWDCAEQFIPGPPDEPRDRWRIVPGTGGDCSVISDLRSGDIDRVHLLTVVPVTISTNDVDLRQRRKFVEVFVTAKWGNVFGNAGDCAPTGCALSPLMNSAFLVPDE